MDIPEIIKKRHSTREFKEEPVSREVLDALIESARQAPSACNLQLTEYIVLDDAGLIKDLREKVSEKFSWAPNFIIAIYDPRFTKHRYAGVQSTGMAIENILLAAGSFGIGACPIAGFENDKKLKEALKIPDLYEVALVLAVGRPKDGYEKKKERLPLPRILHHNYFEKKNNTLRSSMNVDDWSIDEVINYRQRIAPVYLYKNHFRLGEFNPKIISAIADWFLKNADINEDGALLDIMTYDGDFVKELLKRKSNLRLAASDYLPYVLNEIKSYNPKIKTVLINNDNKLEMESAGADFLTCVNKLEFTPQPEKIISEAGRVLELGGKFFMTTLHFTVLGRFSNFFKNSAKANVYEGNFFKKTGAFKIYSQNKIKSLLERGGFGIKSAGVLKDFSKTYNFHCWLCQKK